MTRKPLLTTLSPPSGPIKYKYSDFVTNDEFSEIGIVGPMSCLRADMRIYDAELDRHIPIGELYRRGRAPVVLAWNGESFEPRQASVPFRKGFTQLYEVRLASGASMVGTLEHRVLTPQGWSTLRDLLRQIESGGPQPVACSPGPLPSSWALAPSASRQGALRLMRTTPGSRFDYLQGRRSYDALLRQALGTDPDALPLRAGAPERSQPSWRRDGWGEAEADSPYPSSPPQASFAPPWGASLRAWRLSLFRGGEGACRAVPGFRVGQAPQSFRWWSTLAARAQQAAYATGRRWSASWSRRLSHDAYTTPAASRLLPVAATLGVSECGANLLRQGTLSLHGAERSATMTSVTSQGDRGNHTILGIAPVGADWFYDLHVPGLENYLAEGFINHNTAKTSAAMDRLIRRGMEYPGSNQLLARATLVALKDSSIIRLRQRGQGIFDPSVGGSENTQEGLFRFPKAAHPVTGAMVQSTITGIGLDRADLDVVFKSTEYAGGHLDEANEIPSDAHDFFQERCRQEIWHATRTVKDYCMRLATVWSEVSGKPLAWMDVYNILLDDPLNKVGELQLPPDHPEPGWTTVGASWNPVGNDHTWDRYVGVPYPMPAPSEQWVRDFVGVREVYVEPRELRDDHHTFRAGALIRLPDGSRNYTAKHEGGVVTLVDGSQHPDDQVGLVLQRYCIYAFGHENMSRDHRNVENTYLMVNKKMRKQHQHGHVDVREGRVTPAFVNEPLEYGGHIVPAIDMDRIARSGSLVVGGLDHGGDHPTAFVQGLWISHMNTIIIFDEYVQSGMSAFANATRIKERTIHGLSMVIGYDPAMNARTFDREANHRIIDNYIEVMGNQFVPGTAGPVAFDDLGRALEVQDNFLTDRPPVPGILVTENCEQVIHTMQNLTWKMVQNQRGNWMVDVGDALKLMRSVVKQGYTGQGASHVVAEPKLAYSDRWNDGSPIGGL